MDKDNRYWNVHKEVFNKITSELDIDIVNKIYRNPNCAEGQLLNKRVEQEVQERLQLEQPA